MASDLATPPCGVTEGTGVCCALAQADQRSRKAESERNFAIITTDSDNEELGKRESVARADRNGEFTPYIANLESTGLAIVQRFV